jgi:hypothetical protein
MSMEVLFAGIRVRELAPATDWYSRLFGREADIVPNDQEVMWRVSDGGWVYVIEDPSRAGRSLVTIAVSDIDTEVADLAGRNISMGPIGWWATPRARRPSRTWTGTRSRSSRSINRLPRSR